MSRARHRQVNQIRLLEANVDFELESGVTSFGCLRGCVATVGASAEHRFSKQPRNQIELVAGLGVSGDAHFGSTMQHRSRLPHSAGQPNSRQVHLLQDELLKELASLGFRVEPGDLGENILTSHVPLLDLPQRARLHMGGAIVELAGLRNPCLQIENFRTGLLAAVLGRASDGQLVRKAGVMATVLKGGAVRAGDAIEIELPEPPHIALAPV